MSLYDDLNSLDDLKGLIAADERESEILEYKTASQEMKPSERQEAAKDISAFANSLGGLLIYGIATDSKDVTKPVRIEAIHPANVNHVIHYASSNIRHPIRGLRWKVLPTASSAEALLVDVPASAMAPHQVLGAYRYYHRHGAESVPMGHDLVELYFGRRLGPVVEAKLRIIPRGQGAPADTGYSGVVDLYNAGHRAAREVLVRAVFPAESHVKPTPRLGFDTVSEHKGEIVWPSLVQEALLYPGLPTSVLTIRFQMGQWSMLTEDPQIYLDVYADEMQARRYGVRFAPHLSEAPRPECEYIGVPPVPEM